MYLIEKRKLYSKVEKKKKIKKCQFFHPPSHLPLLSSPLACFLPLQIGQDSPSLRLLLFHPSPATCRCTHTLPATTHPSSTSHPLTPQSGSFFFVSHDISPIFRWHIEKYGENHFVAEFRVGCLLILKSGLSILKSQRDFFVIS